MASKPSSFCLSVSSPGTIGMCQHDWLAFKIFLIENVYYYGGLNDSNPHWLIYLIAWSPVVEPFGEGLGDVTFKVSKADDILKLLSLPHGCF